LNHVVKSNASSSVVFQIIISFGSWVLELGSFSDFRILIFALVLIQFSIP